MAGRATGAIRGWVELLADDPAAAERELRRGYETLGEIGELGWLSTLVAHSGRARSRPGSRRRGGASRPISQESADDEDAYSQALWRSVRAKVLARRGEPEDAERLAREAIARADTTDFLHLRWHVYASAGDAPLQTGNSRDAGTSLSEAVALADAKGSSLASAKARDLLEHARAAAGRETLRRVWRNAVVVGVRWTFGGKDAGSLDSSCYRGDR